MHRSIHPVLRVLPSLLLLALLLPLTGCGYVRSSRPVAERTDPEIARQLEGVWLGAGGEPLLVKCDDRGIIHVGTIRWKDGRFLIETGEAVIVRVDGKMYASMRSPEVKDQTHPWMFARLEIQGRGDDLSMVTASDANRIWFRKAVESGRIKGSVKDRDVRIDGSPAELFPLLDKARENAEAPFEEEAHAAVRVRKEI